ncbi:hypothetical protein [Umezawaea sp.]|uniref:hypothetical protein n=1 Tax=Umezawaea sp. TaxID=1955258 RepID=UPI002ED3D3E7
MGRGVIPRGLAESVVGGRFVVAVAAPPEDRQGPAVPVRLAEARLHEPAYLAAHPGEPHPLLRDDAVECLRRQGVTARGGEAGYGDHHGQAEEGPDFNDCLTAAAKAEFPGLPGAITVFC